MGQQWRVTQESQELATPDRLDRFIKINLSQYFTKIYRTYLHHSLLEPVHGRHVRVGPGLEGQHHGDGVHPSVLEVRPRVLLQVVLPAEALAAVRARKRTKTAVYPLVSGQLLVPGERLAAVLLVALERTLT
jgi:hypothetical protein